MNEIKILNPGGKKIHFSLDKYTCYKRKTGKCSLDNITIEELLEYTHKREYNESSVHYCRSIAKLLLHNKFLKSLDMPNIYYYKKCNHYSCSDGQHRTCITENLFKKGVKVDLNILFEEEDNKCRYCLIQEDFQKRRFNVSIIDKILRNKITLIEEEKRKYEEVEYICSFN